MTYVYIIDPFEFISTNWRLFHPTCPTNTLDAKGLQYVCNAGVDLGCFSVNIWGNLIAGEYWTHAFRVRFLLLKTKHIASTNAVSNF